jgi:transposase
MKTAPFLSLGESFCVEHMRREATTLLVLVRSTSPAACCPVCASSSESVHSQYERTVTDLPWGGSPLRLQLIVRRFFCRNSLCIRRIFTERLPDLVQPWAHMTNRLREALRVVSFATSAEAGSRLAPHVGMRSWASTLLRSQRATSLPQPEPFTKIGLDDFAFRRGRTYGTLIVNLENHRLIEVLPDCSVTTVAAWLVAHPTIDLISRDRASDYAAASTLGAPQARQVCDRWHVLRNLSEYVALFLARMRAQVRKASQALAPARLQDVFADQPQSELEAVELAQTRRRQKRHVRKTVLEQAKEARLAQRLDQYQQILELRDHGLSSYEIAPRVGFSARTVRRWLANGVETRPRRRRPSPLDRYAPSLRQRFEQGYQSGERLYEELQAKGYTGSSRALYRYLKRWRPSNVLEETSPVVVLPSKRRKKTAPPPGPFDQWNAKQAVWLYLRSSDELTPAEEEQLTFLWHVHPALESTYQLVQAFAVMLRTRKGEHLETWLEQVSSSHIPELLRFAAGVERDKAAVQAALQLPYSNGVVEGHVHRLKLIKRQGYGRASFPLLRLRVLYQAA